MPYKVFSEDDRYCVYKLNADGAQTGESLGCHDSEDEATAQLEKLKASEVEKAGGSKVWKYSQEETAYTPLSATDGQACAACRWFKTDGDEYSPQDSCHIVQDWPDSIEPTGWCNRFEARKREAYEVAPMPVVIVEASESDEAGESAKQQTPTEDDAPVTRKGVRQLLTTLVAELFGVGEPDPQAGGFKVYKASDGTLRWLGKWTNNFKDREGEFFTEKAIDDYIARVDMGLVPYPELWHWHVPGSKHGQADWLGRVGHFVLASGTFDDTPLGRAAAKAYASGKQRYSMSHGFTYDRRFKRGGVYHQFNTFELTTLPPPVAANAFTDFEGVKSMTLTQEKREALEKFFGKDKAADIIAEAEAASKALEDLNVEFKDFAHVDAEAEADKEAVAGAEKAFAELLPDLMEGGTVAVQAATEAVKRVKALETTIEAQRKELDALKALVADKPRVASKDQSTELTPERLVELLENVEKQQKAIDPFWGTEVTAKA